MQICYLASRVPGEGRIPKFTVKPGFVFPGCPSPQSFSTAYWHSKDKEAAPGDVFLDTELGMAICVWKPECVRVELWPSEARDTSQSEVLEGLGSRFLKSKTT